MNVAESRHCAGCGQALDAPSLSIVDTEFRCSDCALALDRVDLDHGALFDCPGCGGQFVNHEVLRALLERRESLVASALPTKIRRENPLDQRVVYRPCPACQALMNRRNFGGTSGIIVDLCALHGTWFDRMELPRVLAFVASGGLEQARKLETEAARQRRPPADVQLPSLQGDDYPELDLGKAARELLELIVDLVRGRA